MRLLYFNEKLTSPLLHGGKTIKKHVSVKKLIYKDIFAEVEVIKTFIKTKKIGKRYTRY